MLKPSKTGIAESQTKTITAEENEESLGKQGKPRKTRKAKKNKESQKEKHRLLFDFLGLATGTCGRLPDGFWENS